MEAALLAGIAIFVVVVVVSVALFFAFSGSRKAPGTVITSLEEKAEEIDKTTGKKKKAYKPPWKGRKGETQDSPKVEKPGKVDQPKSEKAPKMAVKESPKSSPGQSSVTRRTTAEKKQATLDKRTDSPKAETSKKAEKREELDKSVEKRPVPSKDVPSKEEPAKAEAVAAVSKEPAKPKSKASGKKSGGTLAQVKDLIEQINPKDEDLQILVEYLLSKREENEDWQEAGGKVTGVQQLKKQIDELSGKLEDARQSAELYKTKLTKLQGEQKMQVSKLSKDLQAANQHLFAKQEELNKAKKKLEEAKESDISQQTLQGMTEEIERLQNQLTLSNQKVSHLDADNQKLSGQLKEASLQVETLSNAADTPQSSPQDVALLKEEIESLKSKLSQQTSEASKSRELSNQIEELQKDLEDSKDEQQRLTSELDGKQFGIQRLETQVQSLNKSIASEKEDHLRQLEQCTAQLKKEREESMASIHLAHQKEIASLKADQGRLMVQVTDEQERSKEKEVESQQLLQKVSSLQEQLTQANNSADPSLVEQLREENKCLSTELAQTKERLHQQEEELVKDESMASDAQLKESQITELTSQNEQLRTQVQQAREQLTGLDEMMRKKDSELQKVQENTDGNVLYKQATAEELEHKEEQIWKFSQENEKLVKENKTLEQRLSEMKQKNGELYDKYWKVSDEAAAEKRKLQEELRVAVKREQENINSAATEQSLKDQEHTKAILLGLVPNAVVEQQADYEEWLQEFVSRMKADISNGVESPQPSSSEIEELESALREKENSEIELQGKVAHLHEVLERTNGNLSELQQQVQSKMAVIQNEMKEKDTSMNNMTEQLSKYKLQIEELSREKDALQQKLDQLEIPTS